VIAFDAAHKAVYYPSDRRFRIWIKPSFIVVAVCLALIPLVLAWVQAAVFGLPYLPPVPEFQPATFAGPHGFPWWLRWAHFFNFVFLMMLVRSGLSILADHPRLYFNDHCTPDTEWIRFTPLKIPRDRVWRASDDDRYFSPLIALPGYRHSVGLARAWHFINGYGFIITGLIFIPLLFLTGQWARLVPTSWAIFPQAWNAFVHYANFHFPPEPNGFYAYNALQQIAYFFVVFVFAPIAIVAGAGMSPALVNRFPWFPRVFGGRQGARSIHFLMMLCWLSFIIVHVTLVVLTGFARNMCLANCYFAHDSSGFPVLLLFFDAHSGRSCYPLDRHAGPVARTWRRPFHRCGVASAKAPTPDRESLPPKIAQSARVGPDPRRLAGTLGASNSSAPFRNRTEALDILRPSQSHEQAKVPGAVLIESPSEARPERTERRTHSCGSRNEAT
jgi:thiosulfate reductase cytochrome b subunit